MPAISATHRRSHRAYPQQQRSHTKIILIAIGVVAALLLTTLTYMLLSGTFAPTGATDGDTNAAQFDATGNQTPALTAAQIRRNEAISAGAAPDDPNISYLPTPLVAEYGSLKIHSPVSANNITEIEFHQASYNTALQLTPLVSIVDAQEVADRQGTNHISPDAQPLGDAPLIAEAVSTWRLDSVGPETSAVDVGGTAGTDVYAPVTGTVVKIKTYSLFGLIDDYEIHIQSPEYPELDIVVLHIDDLTIKVGDTITGGSTRIAKIRNIGDVIDNNLSNFTAPGDPGNHCHVQVNDATRESYKGLEGALDIFGGRGYARPEPPPEPLESESAGE
jgi:biotin carboxyl carrier protein